MLTFLKRNIFITILFLSTLSLGFIIFFTFINKSFLQINDTNFQVLLVFTIILLSKYFSRANENMNKEKIDISKDGIRVNNEKKTIYFLLAIYPLILIFILI